MVPLAALTATNPQLRRVLALAEAVGALGILALFLLEKKMSMTMN